MPFGETWFQEGDSVNKPKYNSQELDAETGLYFYNARYYDGEIGRFVTADNIVPYEDDTQSWNRYGYCRNNPISYKDPTGHADRKFAEKLDKYEEYRYFADVELAAEANGLNPWDYSSKDVDAVRDKLKQYGHKYSKGSKGRAVAGVALLCYTEGIKQQKIRSEAEKLSPGISSDMVMHVPGSPSSLMQQTIVARQSRRTGPADSGRGLRAPVGVPKKSRLDSSSNGVSGVRENASGHQNTVSYEDVISKKIDPWKDTKTEKKDVSDSMRKMKTAMENAENLTKSQEASDLQDVIETILSQTRRNKKKE